MELKDQVYILGQIYARLCKVAGIDIIDSPARYQNACRQPMQEITRLMVKTSKGKMPKEDEEYISIRFNDIDTDNDLLFKGTLPIELQGCFQLGFHQSQIPKSAKALIAGTGYNQSEVAEMLGVAPNTVSRWVTGRLKISQEYIYKIEKIYMGLKKEN